MTTTLIVCAVALFCLTVANVAAFVSMVNMGKSLNLYSEALWFLIQEHDKTKIEVGHVSRHLDMVEGDIERSIEVIDAMRGELFENSDLVAENGHRIAELQAALIPQDAQAS